MNDTSHNADTKTVDFSGYLVCIGASAGGLEALERFFKHCSVDSGAAFVVVQHLSADHKSIMNNLLARHTSMPVIVVEDDMAVEANHLYLIPPGSVMRVSSGHLFLTPKNSRGLTLPIDIFFHSLAEAYGKHAVGVILSGTGSDGARGAVAINAAGGFLLAQAPESAAFDGMPRSVIATGLVDAVLPPEELPQRLLAHIQGKAFDLPDKKPQNLPAHDSLSTEEVFSAIMDLLRHIGGIDFADYKANTVMRRIERRQQVCHTPELHQYLSLLESERNEIFTLRRELLISVTSFFRDPEIFQELADKVIGPMVQAKQSADSIRVWVAGVATGEEAYSMGMLFIEAFERERHWPSLKIFATDVDQQCVETAGSGQFAESAAAELSPQRLERFFLRKGDSFVVKNDLRQCIVFARHNLLADPPFTKMDLVVCRNTLIYFKAAAQERVLRTLRHCIVEGGALLLGSSESLAGVSEGLQVISAKHKLFRRKGAIPPLLLDRKLVDLKPSHGARQQDRRRAQRPSIADVVAEAGLAALLSCYAPPAILVNEHHHVVHLYGDLTHYLRAKEGSASLQIGRLLPDSITPVATALLYKAFRDRASLTSDLLELRQASGDIQYLRLAAHPIGGRDEERLVLLCFELEQHRQIQDEPVIPDADTRVRLSILEQELAATRESLQATIEELETANEELQATNEELMASNEELQSSNEELQSVNEEMSTVNAEFQEKVLMLNRVNADLDSMARAAGVATVFVDSGLCITRFSPDACQIFKLREGDLGRPLDDIAHLLEYPDMMQDLAQTLQLGRAQEREVRSLNDRHSFLVRMLPYQVPSSSEQGAVATFVEVTAIHDARRLQSVLDALAEQVVVVDPEGLIVLVNAAWKRFVRAHGDADLSQSGVGSDYLKAAGPKPDGGDAAVEQVALGLRQVLAGSLSSFSLEYACPVSGERRRFQMTMVPVLGVEFGAVISHVDIGHWQERDN